MKYGEDNKKQLVFQMSQDMDQTDQDFDIFYIY